MDNNVDINSMASVIYAPVLSWVQAGNWTDMDAVNIQECEKLPLVPGAGKKVSILKLRV
ncbi:hypothetical protein MKR65_06665 [Acinetobacter baumannii]